MKFNEKLIELRKREGLSQEELGYKLNVTRQTISKWELGQTTPEMDKLTELSKIFNIGVDELINDSEMKFNNENTLNEKNAIEDKPIKNESSKNNKLIITIVAIVAVVLVLIFGMFFSKIGNVFGNIFDRKFNMGDDIKNVQAGIFEQAQNIIEDALTKIDDDNDEVGDKFLNIFDKGLEYQKNMIDDIF